MRILIVEDERKVAGFIRQGLQEEGHAVELAADGAEALDTVLGGPAYDLIVLDLMLPKRDGFGVLKSLCDRGVTTPVLVLTARDSVGDKVTGFDLGADGPVTPPGIAGAGTDHLLDDLRKPSEPERASAFLPPRITSAPSASRPTPRRRDRGEALADRRCATRESPRCV